MKKLFPLLVLIFCLLLCIGLLSACGQAACKHPNAKVTVTATCTQSGIKKTECPDCGKVTEEEIGALGHDNIVDLKNPTCTAPGTRTTRCRVCGESLTETLPATGHSYSVVSQEDATCTKPGKKISHCAACGNDKEEVLPSPGHKYDEEHTQTIPASCTSAGYIKRTCTVCGDVDTQKTAEQLEHVFNRGEVVEPTCTDGGYTWYECDMCHTKEKREPKDALGHGSTIVPDKIEPTCTQDGGEGGEECSRCHTLLKPRTPIPALGHDFGKGELSCTRKDCGVLIGDEKALELRFAGAKTYLPKAAGDIPSVILDDNVILDLTEYEDDTATAITVKGKNLRIIGKLGKTYTGLSLDIDSDLETCFIDLHGASINLSGGTPLLRSNTSNVVYLCSSGRENKCAAAEKWAIVLPNATFNIVGGTNLQITVDTAIKDPDDIYRPYDSFPAISAKEIVLYPYVGAEFSIRGGTGANGKDGMSYKAGNYATSSTSGNTANSGGSGEDGVSGGDTVHAEKATLYMAGVLILKGGNGGNGGDGGRGQDSDLPRNGVNDDADGTAGKGGWGGFGGVGGSAIQCSNLIVEYVASGSKVELYAGNGGNGGDGGNGGVPYDGNWRDNAGDGGDGGKGGDAGFCIEFASGSTPSTLNRDITLHGGNGGDGGKGGNGGNGVKKSLSDDSFNGSGGDGGWGGDSYYTKNFSTYESATRVAGSVGKGAAGGAKGTGGTDGNATKGTDSDPGEAIENLVK